MWKCLLAPSPHLPHEGLHTRSSSDINSHNRFLSLIHLNLLTFFLLLHLVFISGSSSILPTCFNTIRASRRTHTRSHGCANNERHVHISRYSWKETWPGVSYILHISLTLSDHSYSCILLQNTETTLSPLLYGSPRHIASREHGSLGLRWGLMRSETLSTSRTC